MSVCPECTSWRTKTHATRQDTRYNWRWRSKECLDCGERYESYEIPSQFLSLPEEWANPDGKLVK